MRLLEMFGLSDLKSEYARTIKLDGPFLPDDYFIHNKDDYYKSLCKNLSKCNLIISRDFLALSQDIDFQQRDDIRIELGMTHHIHQLGLIFNNANDYEVVSIDHFIIVNPSDAKTIKYYIDKNPFSERELKHINGNERRVSICT